MSRIMRFDKKLFSQILIMLFLVSACTQVSSPNAGELETSTPEPLSTPAAAGLPSPQASPTRESSPSVEPTNTIVVVPSDTPNASPTIHTTVATLTAAVGSPTETPQQLPASPPGASKAIIVDHRSVQLFEQIPDEYLEAARDLHMVFVDQSVGVNINEGLDCLAANSWSETLPSCRRDYYGVDGSTWLWKTYGLAEHQSGQVPDRIQFIPNPTRYDRSNWSYDRAAEEWERVIEHFVQNLTPQYIDQKDVLSFQFNYFHIGPDSNIADPELGFFVDQPQESFYNNRLRWDISDLQDLEARYPEKIFIYWTTSLARSIGTPQGTEFNDQMRAYAIANEKILFDVAAILSHDFEGNACYDNRDGEEYCTQSGECENYPDDGQDYPAICQEYTSEHNAGHLGSVSGGKLRVAKAFWVLMAMIAGWEG